MTIIKRFGDLVELLPDATIIADQSGNITLVNSLAESLFGYDRYEMYGQSIDILVPASARGHHKHVRQKYTENPHSKQMSDRGDLRGLRKDGSVFPVEIGLNVIDTRSGMFVVSSIRDVTERLLWKNELHIRQTLFEHVAENVHETIWVQTEDCSETLYVNNTYETMFGRPGTELFDNPQGWLDAVHPDDRERLEQASKKNNGNGGLDETYRIVLPDGTERNVHSRTFAIGDVKNRVDRLVSLTKHVE